MVMTGFEGGTSVNQKNLEMARSKFLLDKLTNKLPPELRGGKMTKLPPLNADGDTEVAEPTEEKVQTQADGTFGHSDDKGPKEVVEQQWSDLDKYIELLLESKSDEETVFIYLNPNLKTGDPYDLEVADYSTRYKERYYTLSGKGLTLYENDSPVEFL